MALTDVARDVSFLNPDRNLNHNPVSEENLSGILNPGIRSRNCTENSSCIIPFQPPAKKNNN